MTRYEDVAKEWEVNEGVGGGVALDYPKDSTCKGFFFMFEASAPCTLKVGDALQPVNFGRFQCELLPGQTVQVLAYADVHWIARWRKTRRVEFPDPTPVSIAVPMSMPSNPLVDMQRLVREEVSRMARERGAGSLQEENDFEDDEDDVPRSGFEIPELPPGVRRFSPKEWLEKGRSAPKAPSSIEGDNKPSPESESVEDDDKGDPPKEAAEG